MSHGMSNVSQSLSLCPSTWPWDRSSALLVAAHFAGRTQYGPLTSEQARRKWHELAEDPNTIFDYDNPKKEKQIRIAVRKDVDYRDSHILEKAMSKQRNQRITSDEQLQRVQLDLTRNVTGSFGDARSCCCWLAAVYEELMDRGIRYSTLETAA